MNLKLILATIFLFKATLLLHAIPDFLLQKHLRVPIDPFISGDSFRYMADHIYDEVPDKSLFDISQIKAGDIIFVNGDFLIEFLENYHMQIK